MANYWYQVLDTVRSGIGGRKGSRRLNRLVPSGRRWKGWHVPFSGVFAIPARVIGIRPSRKNPHLCTVWYELAPPGGEETEVSVLFVDVRGFTSLSEKVSPTELTVLMNRFYSVASEEVVRLDGTVDKFVGDQVMAFFGAPYRPEDHAERAVEAAVAITKAVNDMSNELAVGAGVSTGVAFVGNVGTSDVNDFTALGDVVNVASRLQGHASAGEVLLAERTYERLGETHQSVDERQLELRGKAGTTRVWVLRP